MKLNRWLVSCCLFCLLAGCGQMGDLYLPSPTPLPTLGAN